MRLAFLFILFLFYIQLSHGEADDELFRKETTLNSALYELRKSSISERILPLSDSIIREAKKIGYVNEVISAYQIRCQYLWQHLKLTDEQRILQEVESYKTYALKNNFIAGYFDGWDALILFYTENESFKAISEIEKYRADAIKRNLPKYIGRSFRSMGNLNFKEGEMDLAIDNYRKGAEYSDMIDDWNNSSYCYSLIGTCLISLHDFNGAIKAWNKSIKRYKGYYSKLQIAGDRTCQAICYYYLGDYKKMRSIYNDVKTVDVFDSFSRTRQLMLRSYMALINKEYTKSLIIADSIENDLLKFTVKEHIFCNTHNYKEGWENLSKALTIDKEKYEKMERRQNEIIDVMFYINYMQKHMKQMNFKSSQIKMKKELLHYSMMKEEEEKHIFDRQIEIQNANIKIKKMIKKNLIEKERHKALVLSLDSQYKRNKALLIQNIIIISFASGIIISFIGYGWQRKKYIRQLKKEEKETNLLRKEAAWLHEKAENDRAIAEDANNIKSKFLHNVSNRVCIPLNTIVTFANLLISNKSANTVDKKKYMAIIEQSAARLSIFIYNILDYSNLTTGKYQMNINKCLVTNICMNAIKETNDNKLPIITEISSKTADSIILTDELRSIRVVAYLIDNLFIYTQKGVIRINCEITKETVSFIISNDDVTINQEQKNSINRFLTRAEGGAENDMSLHLCHVIATILNGICYLETEEKKGTRFVFKQPCLGLQDSQTNND
jgi:signal transduction histidine kinase